MKALLSNPFVQGAVAVLFVAVLAVGSPIVLHGLLGASWTLVLLASVCVTAAHVLTARLYYGLAPNRGEWSNYSLSHGKETMTPRVFLLAAGTRGLVEEPAFRLFSYWAISWRIPGLMGRSASLGGLLRHPWAMALIVMAGLLFVALHLLEEGLLTGRLPRTYVLVRSGGLLLSTLLVYWPAFLAFGLVPGIVAHGIYDMIATSEAGSGWLLRRIVPLPRQTPGEGTPPPAPVRGP